MTAPKQDHRKSAAKGPSPRAFAPLRVSRRRTLPAPSVLAHLALAQYALGLIVISVIYRPLDPNLDSSMRLWMLACAGALTFAFLCLLTMRIYIQDWLSTISGPERLFLILLLLAALGLPGPPRDHNIIPEGFATCLPAMLFFSASGSMARRYVFMALLGFWAGISHGGGLELEWILGFGAALLWNLSAIHFAFTGAPFGLRGWWPILRVWQTVILYFIPAGLAASLFYNLWPEPPALQPVAGRPQIDARLVMQRMMDFNQMQWREIIIRAAIACVLITIALVTLYYLRKYLGRKIRPQALPVILGAEIGEIEYSTGGPREDKPVMSGNRGRMLRLWRRWERAVQPGPEGREPDETADEFARRVPSERAGSSPKPAIAVMLEKAHYSPTEPTDDEVKVMEDMVETDLQSRK